MKKIFSIVLCVVLLFSCTAVLLACSGGEKVIMLWGPEDHRSLYLKWAEEFRATHEDAFRGYKFEFAGSGDAGASAEMAKDVTKGAALYSFPNDQMADLANLGALSTLTAADVEWIKEHNTEASVSATIIGENYKAYPLQADNGYYLYYNRDAFKNTSVWDSAKDGLKDDYTFADLYKALDERGMGDAVYKNSKGEDIKLNWSNGLVCMPMASAWYLSSVFFSVGGDYEVVYNAEGKQQSAACWFGYEMPEGVTAVKDADYTVGLNAIECLKNICLNKDGSVNKHYYFAKEDYNDKYAIYINTANEDAVKTPFAAMLCGTWNDKMIRKYWGEENYDATYLPTLEGLDGNYAAKNFCGYKHLGVNPMCEFVTDNPQNIVILHEMAKYFTSAASQIERYQATGAGPSNKEALNNEEIKNDKALKALNKQYERVCVYPAGSKKAGQKIGNGLGFRIQDSVPSNYWTPLANFGEAFWLEFSTQQFKMFHQNNLKKTLAELQLNIENAA